MENFKSLTRPAQATSLARSSNPSSLAAGAAALSSYRMFLQPFLATFSAVVLPLHLQMNTDFGISSMAYLRVNEQSTNGENCEYSLRLPNTNV